MRIARIAALAALAVAGSLPAAELYVPVVAQVRGADGSYWNTELWLTNTGSGPAVAQLLFLPAGRDNAALLANAGHAVRLAPGVTVHLTDVVPPGATGALRVRAPGAVVVRCRLYNATGRGSLGQMVPALALDDMVPPGATAVLSPLVRTPRFRTNVGFFNPGENAVTVEATVRGADGAVLTRVRYEVPPGSQVQVNDVLLAYRVRRAEGATMELVAEAPFAAYASLVDTRSGAPTLILPTVLP